MISCVFSFVYVMWQGTCSFLSFFVLKENGSGAASPGCSLQRE
jgi:hypothetical protein